MQKIQRTYKFRLYPKPEHEERLLGALEVCRQTYNYFLSQWDGKEKIPRRFELQAQLPKLKKERPELKKVYSRTLQMALYQLYSNLRALSGLKKVGKRVGRLRFKGNGWYKTINYNQSGFKMIKTGKRLDLLHLSKIGDIPIRVHRPIDGKIKQVIIKRYNSGKWFACISIEKEINIVQREPEKAVGIDVGVRHFLTDSEGRQVENPRFYQRTLQRIQGIQHWLSKKKKGSKNREKMRIKLAKVYEKLTNQRDDFLHKLSRYYVNNYDLICVEDLNITNMVKNHSLAQSILDASWGKFLTFLSYKAESAGKRVVRVNPRGTSEGLIYEDPYRDFISARRILYRGWGVPVSPAEMEPLLVEIPASSVVEAGSPRASVVGSPKKSKSPSLKRKVLISLMCHPDNEPKITKITKITTLEGSFFFLNKVRGYANALRKAMEMARLWKCDLVVADSDGYHPLSEILKLANAEVGGDYYLVKPFRTNIGIQSRLFTLLYSFLRLKNIRDVTGGMWRISYPLICLVLDKLRAQDMSIQIEVVDLAIKARAKIIQYPYFALVNDVARSHRPKHYQLKLLKTLLRLV